MTFSWSTFALQLVNVLILLAILRHFLFRPVAAVIAQRRATIAASMRTAEDARIAAEIALDEARRRTDESAAARHEVLAKAQADAEAASGALLEQARAKAATIIAEGRAALAHEADALNNRAVAAARDLAIAIAARAVAAQPRSLAGYADRLGQALAAMAPEERRALLGGANPRLVSATPLAPHEIDSVTHALLDVGIRAPVTTDASLVAGLEFHSDNGRLRNSLAHDLECIAKSLKADDRAA